MGKNKFIALLAAGLLGVAAVAGAQEITRNNEGNYFYTSITIPPGAETMYLSGSGARPMADGSWGDMKQQTVNTFSRFKQTLEEQGWSEFFGTADNPMKPVRSFVEIKDLVVEGWLVEIEIRAARMPD